MRGVRLECKDPKEFEKGNECKGKGKLRRLDHDSLASLDEIPCCWSYGVCVFHDHDHDVPTTLFRANTDLQLGAGYASKLALLSEPSRVNFEEGSKTVMPKP